MGKNVLARSLLSKNSMALSLVETVSTENLQELSLLINVLPVDLQEAVRPLAERLASDRGELLEIVMDLGRTPEARLASGAVNLRADPVAQDEINHIVSMLGQFSDDNRAGIERTLHRISCIRNRKGQIIGLTLRVGRAVLGTIDLLRDLIESGRNILFLGPPGVGKTTKLREVARVLGDEFEKRVIVIDTSNEIAGDGDIPHPAIGSARRMQVPHSELQHRLMIEAVENHMPESIIVDEIGTEAEAAAARTIAERGVQLIGTAHGTTLENLVMNPTVADLIGGVHTVTLSDEEARKRRTSKTISERKAPPTFDIVVEMVNRDEVVVYSDTAEAVDHILAGEEPEGERRTRNDEGKVEKVIEAKKEEPVEVHVLEPMKRGASKLKRIYAYGVPPDLIQRVIRDLKIDARIVAKVDHADFVLALRSREDDDFIEELSREKGGAPILFVKRNSTAQIRRLLRKVFQERKGFDSENTTDALQEAEDAVRLAMEKEIEVVLTPRSSPLRRLQHQVVAGWHLNAESQGIEPNRHLVVYPPQWRSRSKQH